MTEQRAMEVMSSLATEIAEVLRLEASGQRDGSGYWRGSDVIGHVLNEDVPQLARMAEQCAHARITGNWASVDVPSYELEDLPF
jgi:hypothetical protein